MQTQKKYFIVALLSVFVIFQFASNYSVKAQTSDTAPEMSVAGIELGSRESAKAFLKSGYQPRVGKDGRPTYYFYNKWGSQVMKLTAASFDDPYFLTEIEVFSVGEKYQERHFQAEEVKYFETENKIFIGFKQSTMYFIAGVKNKGSNNEITPKAVVEIKGEPSKRADTDKNREVLSYNIAEVKVPGAKMEADYQADYEFYKNKLKRFSIKLVLDKTMTAKK